MKKLLLHSLLLLALSNAAQVSVRTCGTPTLTQQFESWLQSVTPANPGKLGTAQIQSVFNIPVIVHVIHNNEAVNSPAATSGNNLSAAQIIDQINILNRDFTGTNLDTILIPGVFKPVQGKFNINFCLAVVNPTGGVLAEPGIDRINRVAKGWNSSPYSQNYINSTIKPNSIWDPNKYLNIWVCELSNGLLGYATFPNPASSGILGLNGSFGTATTDGVVSLNTAFGSIGTAQSGQYNKGRTTTHEVGHWLGLRHIWGDGSCATDYCNDTPPAQNANYNCPSFPYKLGTCSGNTTGEMTMNYMDYTNDACMYMFTADQKYRAQLILTNSPIRAALITSTVCNLPASSLDAGISYVSNPTYSQSMNCPGIFSPVINLTNFGAITLTSAVIAFNIDGVNTQTINWTGNLLSNTSTLLTLPQMNISSMGSHVFSVTISSANAGNDANLLNNHNSQNFYVSGNFLSVSSATTCPGVPVTVSASGATSYSWNTGATGSTIAPGPQTSTTYTVFGTNGGCTGTKTVNVTVKPLPVVNVNNQVACYNTATVVTASGANSYSWSSGSTNASANITLSATTVFTVTGFSSPGCFTHKIFTVTVNPLPVLTLTASNLSCGTCTDGTISATASGAAPFSYAWMPGGANTSDLYNVAEGCYTVTITDALGCISEANTCVSFDVGMKQNNNELMAVSVLPNPSGGLFVINGGQAIINHIIITDALGRIILEQKINATVYELDLMAEAKGIYYLRASAANGFKAIKLVKE